MEKSSNQNSTMNNFIYSFVNKKRNLAIILLLLFIFIILAILVFHRLTTYNSPSNLNQEYTLSNGLKFNYNKNWNISQDNNLGLTLILTNNDQTNIAVSTSNIEVNQSLNDIINLRLSTLKKDEVEINVEDININNINFKHIVLTNKITKNIVSSDFVNSYVTLDNKVYSTFSIISKPNSNLTEANQIIYSIRKT